MIEQQALKHDLAKALDAHIAILQDVEFINPDNMEAFTFMMRSFGFMLDKAPEVLIKSDPEELYFTMFQYYSLLKELKYNIQLSYPHATLKGIPLMDLLKDFPATYESDLREWWEKKTGLKIESGKQTISIDSLE
ncbi:hypothetical protein QUW13_01515 [Enterococcus hirae]|nr:hypothetical protein [Enterococcus hirae]